METNKLFETTSNLQMLFRKSINKTKNFVHKTIKGLKYLLLGGHKKLSRSHAITPLFSCHNHPKMQELDNFYIDLSEQESEHNEGHEAMTRQKKSTISEKEPSTRAEGASTRSFTNNVEQSVVKTTQENRGNEEKKTCDCHEQKRREPCPQIANEGTRVFSRKMKELEKMEVDDDVDQVLDIEEVFRHYSLLNSPVYLDIVDNFVIDIFSDFFIPQPSASVNNSMRRLGPATVNNSMRSLGPASVNNSRRRLGPASVNNSMRSLGPAIVNNSIRRLGSAIVNNSMRSLGPIKL